MVGVRNIIEQTEINVLEFGASDTVSVTGM
jgi:hypothetical protein